MKSSNIKLILIMPHFFFLIYNTITYNIAVIKNFFIILLKKYFIAFTQK